MSTISVKQLSFAYPGQKPLFTNCHFDISSDWKLGLLGRNGRGKTTMMKILLGQLDYRGTVESQLNFAYFPLTITDPHQLAGSALLAASNNPNLEQWQIERELNLMKTDPGILWQAYATLSGGEQTKAQLAVLLAQENKFFLLDEPTNHLDLTGRQLVAAYLKAKRQGLIITSHDQDFLNQVIDHTLVIERQQLVLEQGNYATYSAQKKRRDKAAIHSNQQLRSTIKNLKKTRQQRLSWAQRAESEKKHNSHADKGFIGAKSARMMKKTITTTNRLSQTIEQCKGLLTEVEEIEPLSINYVPDHHQTLLTAKNLCLSLDGQPLFQPLSFALTVSQQLSLIGPNGAGKTSLIQALRGQFAGRVTGQLQLAAGLTVSYVRQNFSSNHGSLQTFAATNHLPAELLLTILRKLGMERTSFSVPIEKMSMGQQKKIELARSLSQKANLYIWDEPLNYLDTYNQEQLSQLIRQFRPPLLFVEHDQHFINAVASQQVRIQPLAQR